MPGKSVIAKRKVCNMTPEVKERIDQLRHGIVPEGYRKTKAGIVPTDWSEYTIADCLERVERPVEVKEDEMYMQIGIRSHGKGLFYKEPVSGKSLGNKAVFWIEPDCFVLNIVFAWEQAIGKTTQAAVGMVGSHRFPMYRPVDGRIDIDYLISYLMTKRGKDILEAASPGGAGRNRTLGQDRFMKSKIVLPTPEEQKKIAEILTTQDKVIELKEKILAEKQRQKKYLMQQLLIGKKHLPGFNGEWDTAPIGKFLESRNTKQIPCAEAPLMAFVAGEGVTTKGERYDRSHLVKDDAKKYKRTELNDLIYSSNNLDVGSIGLNKYGTAVISVVYEIFKAKENTVPAVISEIIQSPKNLHHILSYRQGAFYGQYRIFAEDFLSVPITVPCYEEQLAIGAVLNAANQEIDLLRQNIEHEKQKKKALMQLLLTGIVRVSA